MTTISAALIKDLRERTGAGMMDCKKALVEVGGDLEKAVDALRKKGLSIASQKAGRIAAEGLVGVLTKGNKGVVIEVNTETDFVGRNEIFQKFVKNLAERVLDQGVLSLENLQKMKMPSGERSVEEELTHLIAVIGENIQIRRFDTVTVEPGSVASYVHRTVVPGVGSIGVLLGLESTASPEKLQELGRKIAMHIAAAAPQFLSVSDVDQSALDRERSVLLDQARQTGRAEDVVEKMVEGRLKKYYEEVVLEEQIFVVDGKQKVSKVVADAAKEIGCGIKLTAFKRFSLGEGIEKAQTNFAEEVQAQLK